MDSFCAMFSLVLLLILTISIRLVTGSIIVSALKVSSVSLIVIFHGPIRSTAISCHGAALASLAAIPQAGHHPIAPPSIRPQWGAVPALGRLLERLLGRLFGGPLGDPLGDPLEGS